MSFCKEQTPINADRIPVAGNQAVVAADSELLTHGSHHCLECVSSQTDDDRRVDDFYQPPKQWFAFTEPACLQAASQAFVSVPKNDICEEQSLVMFACINPNGSEQLNEIAVGGIILIVLIEIGFPIIDCPDVFHHRGFLWTSPILTDNHDCRSERALPVRPQVDLLCAVIAP